MNDDLVMRFESILSAPMEQVWDWITSVKGISAEMRPFLRMTAPRHIRSLADTQIELGSPLFRSYIFLFGIIPIDYSEITLVKFNQGRGFVEQSPMGSMKLWRHERQIVPCPSRPDAVLLIDQLTFRPRFARGLTRGFIRRVFTHRHRVLRENLGGV